MKLKLFTLLFYIVLGIVVTAFDFKSELDPHQNQANNPLQLSEESYKSFYSGNVTVNKLFNEDDLMGYAVWMKRSGKKVKAKYFACGEANKRYEEWRSNRKIVMACSGAFTTNDFGSPLPVGLTVDNGLVVNKNINEDMDGLVIVYGTGGIVVSDIDEGDLHLGSINKKVDVRESWDRFELIKWAEKEEATIFQTQLLAFGNKLRLDVNKARKDNRERRILVLVKDKSNTLFHIIFDVHDGVYLGEIAEAILNYFKSKDCYVAAMLNLDTGWYNLMKIYDEKQLVVLKKNPDKSPTNLLTYYYEE
jgi:exopolysaccharide biosynthesis protein